MSLSAFLRIHLSIHICSWIPYIIAKKQNLFLDLFLLWVFSFLLSFFSKAAAKLYILVKWAFFKPQIFFSILYLLWSCTIWPSHEIFNADSFKCTAKQSFIILIYLLWLGGNHLYLSLLQNCLRKCARHIHKMNWSDQAWTQWFKWGIVLVVPSICKPKTCWDPVFSCDHISGNFPIHIYFCILPSTTQNFPNLLVFESCIVFKEKAEPTNFFKNILYVGKLHYYQMHIILTTKDSVH